VISDLGVLAPRLVNAQHQLGLPCRTHEMAFAIDSVVTIPIARQTAQSNRNGAPGLDAGIHAEWGPKMESLVDHTGDPQTDFELLPEVNAR
jgi:hypothetical protein